MLWLIHSDCNKIDSLFFFIVMIKKGLARTLESHIGAARHL
jgi:hypothetical protein